jgi:soluble epoxide hydrolase / lipid-phosphate phosphatase
MKGNFDPALNWCRAAIRGLNNADEDEARLDPKLKMPVLFIETAKDPLSGGPMAVEGMRSLCENFGYEKLDVSHWAQLEGADGVNRILGDFTKSA